MLRISFPRRSSKIIINKASAMFPPYCHSFWIWRRRRPTTSNEGRCAVQQTAAGNVEMGHSRYFGRVRPMSALPPESDRNSDLPGGRLVPFTTLLL